MSTAPLRVLVADDSPTTRDMLAAILVAENFAVTLASDGREALTALDTGPVDVLLLDMVMPVLDAVGVLADLQARGRLDSLPVLVMTAGDARDVRVLDPWEGRVRVLYKPFAPEDLVRILRGIACGLAHSPAHETA